MLALWHKDLILTFASWTLVRLNYKNSVSLSNCTAVLTANILSLAFYHHRTGFPLSWEELSHSQYLPLPVAFLQSIRLALAKSLTGLQVLFARWRKNIVDDGAVGPRGKTMFNIPWGAPEIPRADLDPFVTL